MCGVFGFITKNGNGPDLARLRRIAVETQTRGDHAFGLAWLSEGGAIHTFKRPGPATANLGDVDACRGATVVIGHCRWATHGDPQENRNNHPHPAGRGFVVHNGVVLNHASLTRQYGFAPETECDSEVLGLLMARMPGALGFRAARTAELTLGSLAMLGVWRKPTRLLVVRNGRPLHFSETAGGYYFASLPGELPGRAMAITDRYAGVLAFENGALRHDAYKIKE